MLASSVLTVLLPSNVRVTPRDYIKQHGQYILQRNMQDLQSSNFVLHAHCKTSGVVARVAIEKPPNHGT